MNIDDIISVQRISRDGQEDMIFITGRGFINKTIPVDNLNKDYRKIMEWEKEQKIIIENVIDI